MNIPIPVGVSARHVHLNQKDLEALFGIGYELIPYRPLSQPGQFASEEILKIIGPKGQFNKVRVLGPLRKKTQIEISMTDSLVLGIKAPLRESGDLNDTPGIVLSGPKGSVTLDSGVIIAARHIHFHSSEAARYGILDKQDLSVQIEGERGSILHHVSARVSDDYQMELHLDTDEANACGAKNGDTATIIMNR
ncbi:phosphate propanoyltransferase [Paenibacillus sp. Soil750]|uniref:phosphate propanoyltransferase n=1 Tax=Paenibacillus sp. Soil750 TaxID=1736398 RepID=UPI000701C187|nr:phosphate propanoyltransferase [Paenibacillus sp. Soil750]KRE70468.1 propanediol utilization protein [Paenibacillus sp. Soil750]